MHEKDVRFLESCIKKYYFDHYDLIRAPQDTHMREFGYQKFNSGMTRHITLKSDKELRLLLMTSVPSDVYCSNARYSFPNLPMAEKDWQGADLIFDIDAKDLALPCRAQHTCRVCAECADVFLDQPQCPKCGSAKHEKRSVLCPACIGAARSEVKKLLAILTGDLAVKKEGISVYFSGNEGFHVYVSDSGYESLESRERADLVDYVMFRGAVPEAFGAKASDFARSQFPDVDERGWSGRLAREIFGSKSNKPKASKQLVSDGYLAFKKRLGDLQGVIGSRIDPNVTVDVHRIFRLGGTINSKSGLTKAPCADIDRFNPGTDSCFIDSDPVTVRASCPVEFKLKSKKFGPYAGEQVTVPKYAAAYMICKGYATTS